MGSAARSTKAPQTQKQANAQAGASDTVQHGPNRKPEPPMPQTCAYEASDGGDSADPDDSAALSAELSAEASTLLSASETAQKGMASGGTIMHEAM